MAGRRSKRAFGLYKEIKDKLCKCYTHAVVTNIKLAYFQGLRVTHYSIHYIHTNERYETFCYGWVRNPDKIVEEDGKNVR